MTLPKFSTQDNLAVEPRRRTGCQDWKTDYDLWIDEDTADPASGISEVLCVRIAFHPSSFASLNLCQSEESREPQRSQEDSVNLFEVVVSYKPIGRLGNICVIA